MNQINTTTKRDIKQRRTNDKHNNDAFRRRNHEEKNLDICQNHLFILKWREKDKGG